MTPKTRMLTLAFSLATLAWLVPHAGANGSMSQPSTYLGMLVGGLIVGAAWIIGHRRADSNADA